MKTTLPVLVGVSLALTSAAAAQVQASEATPYSDEWPDDGVATRAPPIRIAANQSVTAPTKSTASDRQRTTGDRSDLRTDGLETVVVTAQKRKESLLEVPLSVAAISSEDIERRGLLGVEDYLRGVPGVSQVDRGGIDNAIVIRGVSTAPQSENFSAGATVATYFGETSITGAAGLSGGGIDVRPVDLERIEVLRGPQGTTFGSASLGGALRMIPASPELDSLSGKVTASFGGTSGSGGEDSMVQGVVNAPLLRDTLALRAVGYRFEDSGYYKNSPSLDPALVAAADRVDLGNLVRVPSQDDIGRTVSTGARVSLLWEAGDALSVALTYLTQENEQDGRPEATIGMFQQARTEVDPRVRMRGERGEVQDSHIDLANVTVDYDMGWASLTTTASWVDSGLDAVNITLPPSSSALSTFLTLSDYRGFSAETRLSSNSDRKLRYLAGLFYEDVEASLYQPFGYWPGTPATNRFGTDPFSVFDIERPYDQQAIFGELEYDLTAKVTATVGGRYFEYQKTDRTLQEGGLLGVPYGSGTTTVLESEEENESFKASLAYKPSVESLVYATWAQGFRLGRPDIGAIPSLCDRDGDSIVDGTGVSIASTRSVKSDTLDSYEIGAKFPFADAQLIINASVYRIDWEGVPVRAIPFVNCAYLSNAGEAKSEGVDVQAVLRATDGLTIDLGVGYTNAELANDAPTLGARKGARLPGSPELNANLSLQQDFNLAGRLAFVRIDSRYVGEFYGDLIESPATRAGDYVKVDARAGLALDKLSVELYGRNLTNEDEYTWRAASPAGLLAFQGYRMRPRSYGLQLSYRFD